MLVCLVRVDFFVLLAKITSDENQLVLSDTLNYL